MGTLEHYHRLAQYARESRKVRENLEEKASATGCDCNNCGPCGLKKSPFIQAIEHELRGLKLPNPGAAACCQICLDAFGFEAVADELSRERIDNIQEYLYHYDEPSFSRRPCDSCGSRLGGNRQAGHAFDKDMNVIHLEMCDDCVIFHANGDEPENWKPPNHRSTHQ